MTPMAPYAGMTIGKRSVVSFDEDLGTGCWLCEVPASHSGGAVAAGALLLLPVDECLLGACGTLPVPADVRPLAGS